MQTLDERLDTAMNTLADAEQRLSLAEQSGAQRMQLHNDAQNRCAHGEVQKFLSLSST